MLNKQKKCQSKKENYVSNIKIPIKWVSFFILIYLLFHMETEIDIKLGKMKQREKEISKVVDRYMRMRLKRRVRKIFGINLR